jgi:hypothetical protein
VSLCREAGYLDGNGLRRFEVARETIPSNHVIALVRDPASGSEIVDAFEAASLGRVILIAEPDVERRLAAVAGLAGRMLQRNDDREPSYLEEYEQAVREGQVVVAVRAEGHDVVRRTRELLQRHGATNIRYFGRLAIADLGHGSGATAPSDALRRQGRF